MFQYFEWNLPPNGTLWRELSEAGAALKELGVTSVWIPPPCKAMGGAKDNGYAIYDLWDLGEFNQKGGVATKFGTKEELLHAIASLHTLGIQVYPDIVLNHKMGGDGTETVTVQELRRGDDLKPEGEPYEAEVWSRYEFRGRNGKYSSFTYNKNHFTAFGSRVGGDDTSTSMYLVAGKQLSGEVSYREKNNDYLLGEDLDLYDDEVRADLFAWGKWFLDTTQVDGFRLDAVKHMAPSFYHDWLEEMRKHAPEKELFTFGEYSAPNPEELQAYLDKTGPVMSLLDIPLQTSFKDASKKGAAFDLRTIFDSSFVKADPLHAVTFVESHDSQKHQSESFVEDWFKPLGYAFILLREAGYPVLFYGDYFGNRDEKTKLTSFKSIIDIFCRVRRTSMHGERHDYFDHGNCVGWLWTGDAEHPGVVAVLMSNGEAGVKRMKTFRKNESFEDVTGNISDTIRSDENGELEARCLAGSVSVWKSVMKACE